MTAKDVLKDFPSLKVDDIMLSLGWELQKVCLTSLSQSEYRYLKAGFEITKKQAEDIIKTTAECCIDKQTIKVVILDVLTEEGCYSIGAGVILCDKLFKELGLE